MPTFCDRCGAPLGADDQRCRTCGWPVSAAPPPGREEPGADGSTQRLTAAPAADPGVPETPRTPESQGTDGEGGEHDLATRVQSPVAPAPTTPAPVAEPVTRPAADDEDPYAGWFVDDPQPPAAEPGGAGWTSYDDRSAAGWDEGGWQQYDDDPRLPPPLREDEPLDLDGGARRSGAGRVFGALAAVAVVVLVGLAAIYVGVLRHDGGGTSAGTTPRTSASAPPGSSESGAPTSGGSSAPSSATSTSPYPPVSLTGKECGASGTGPWARAAAGTTATSCPFALAVQQAWLATNPQPGDSRTVDATSPVTGKSYPMTCSGDQPVTCKGGNGAVVYLYGGTATFG